MSKTAYFSEEDYLFGVLAKFSSFSLLTELLRVDRRTPKKTTKKIPLIKVELRV